MLIIPGLELHHQIQLTAILETLFLFDPYIYMTLTGTTTPGQGRPGSNGNEEVLHIPEWFRTGASHSNGSKSYTGNLMWGGLTPLQRCSLLLHSVMCKSLILVIYLTPHQANIWHKGGLVCEIPRGNFDFRDVRTKTVSFRRHSPSRSPQVPGNKPSP